MPNGAESVICDLPRGIFAVYSRAVLLRIPNPMNVTRIAILGAVLALAVAFSYTIPGDQNPAGPSSSIHPTKPRRFAVSFSRPFTGHLAITDPNERVLPNHAVVSNFTTCWTFGPNSLKPTVATSWFEENTTKLDMKFESPGSYWTAE